MARRFFRAVLPIVVLVGLSGCGDDEAKNDAAPGAGAYDPMIDPAEFSSSTTIDNPFMPWVPGMELTYVEDEVDTVRVVVTEDTKTIMGVECVVVHDELTDEDGVVVEDTYDWYAQDEFGNVWYFGEDTVEYDDAGNPDPAGSWEAGVDGALPGIVMPADAVPGEPYRQEFYEGEAEDWGQILEVDVDVAVLAGDYGECLITKDWSGLEPDVVENKWYCFGVGNVKAEVVEGGTGLEELKVAVIP